MKSALAVLLLALTTCTPALAQLKTTADARIDKLLEASGLDLVFPGIEKELLAGIDKSHADIRANAGRDAPEARLKATRDAAKEELSAKAMSTAARRTFKEKLRDADQDAALAWFEAPLGKAIKPLQADVFVRTFNNNDAKGAAAMALRKAWDGVSDERRGRCRRLTQATRLGEASATITVGMLTGIFSGGKSVMPEAGAELDAVIAKVVGQKPGFAAAANEQGAMQCARSYAPLNDADFDRYVAFNESRAGRAFNEATLAALQRALEEGAQRMGERVARASKAGK